VEARIPRLPGIKEDAERWPPRKRDEGRKILSKGVEKREF